MEIEGAVEQWRWPPMTVADMELQFGCNGVCIHLLHITCEEVFEYKKYFLQPDCLPLSE